PTTERASPTSTTISVNAPVPQPTSSHLRRAGTASQRTNSRATGRLQRPMYASSADPTANTSRSLTHGPPGHGSRHRDPRYQAFPYEIVGCARRLRHGG